jgi:hypothetical protein
LLSLSFNPTPLTPPHSTSLHLTPPHSTSSPTSPPLSQANKNPFKLSGYKTHPIADLESLCMCSARDDAIRNFETVLTDNSSDQDVFETAMFKAGAYKIRGLTYDEVIARDTKRNCHCSMQNSAQQHRDHISEVGERYQNAAAAHQAEVDAEDDEEARAEISAATAAGNKQHATLLRMRLSQELHSRSTRIFKPHRVYWSVFVIQMPKPRSTYIISRFSGADGGPDDRCAEDPGDITKYMAEINEMPF